MSLRKTKIIFYISPTGGEGRKKDEEKNVGGKKRETRVGKI